MAATALLGYLLRPGDHLVIPDDAYGGTFRFVARVLGEQGVAWTAVDLTDPAALAGALRAETRLVWVETPTNPMLRVVDIAAVAAVAHAAGARLVVDNTFATPYLQRPLDLGADVVLHSSTKYLGGHSDVVGGPWSLRIPASTSGSGSCRTPPVPCPGPSTASWCCAG